MVAGSVPERLSPNDGPLHQRLRDCMRRYLSRINSEVVIARACGRCGVHLPDLAARHLPAWIDAAEPTLALYLAKDEIRTLISNLHALGTAGRERRSATSGSSPAAQRASVEYSSSRRPTPAEPARWRPRATGRFGQVAAFDDSTEPRDVTVTVATEVDLECARTTALKLTKLAGFGHVDAVKVATVVSELARNMCMYAGQGTLQLRVLASPRRGIEVKAVDHGPGIPDVDLVLSDRYRSRTGLGLGLRGSKQLMDRLEIESSAATGTTITATKLR